MRKILKAFALGLFVVGCSSSPTTSTEEGTASVDVEPTTTSSNSSSASPLSTSPSTTTSSTITPTTASPTAKAPIITTPINQQPGATTQPADRSPKATTPPNRPSPTTAVTKIDQQPSTTIAPITSPPATASPTTTQAPILWVPTCRISGSSMTVSATRLYIKLEFKSDFSGTRPPDNLNNNGSGQTSFTRFNYSWLHENSGFLPGVGSTYTGFTSTGNGSASSFEAGPYGFGHGFEVTLSGAPAPIDGENRTFNVTLDFENGGSCSTSYTYIKGRGF